LHHLPKFVFTLSAEESEEESFFGSSCHDLINERIFNYELRIEMRGECMEELKFVKKKKSQKVKEKFVFPVQTGIQFFIF